jgi:phosphatidylinositol-3-phosphatase
MRCAALALGAALTVGGLAVPARAVTDAPVVLIMMENHAFGASDSHVNGDTTKYIVGNPDAPYINDTLIPSATLFMHYNAVYHPSLPNYLELTGGTNAGCTVDSCARDALANENLFHLLGEAGVSFTSLAESMPSNCTLNNQGRYLVRHNPETYYTDVDAGTGSSYGCSNTDVKIAPASTQATPVAWPNPLPDFTYIAPNYCDDMHGSGKAGVCPNATDQLITAGDTWLNANVPALLSEGAIVIVAFDEGVDGDKTGGGGHVAALMVGPGVGAGATDATTYNHASLLAGLQDYFGLTPLLGDAATATPILVPRATPYPTPAISGLTPESGSIGSQVTIAGTGLETAYTVDFAGTPAAFTIGSDASITATVPAGATTGQVTVRTIGGTATSPDTFTVSAGSPQPALVQHAVGSGTKGTQASATWPQATAAGDLLVAAVGWTGPATVTPPAGWTLAVSSGATAIYYRQNAPSASGPSTFAFSATANWVLSTSEWSGMATSGALDKTAHATGGSTNGTTASSGTTAATSKLVELAIGGIRALANITESAPTAGFAQLDQRSAGANTLGAYDLVTSAAGAQSTSSTLSPSAKWRGVIATFRGA